MIDLKFDGSCKSNPNGAMGFGSVITFADGETITLSDGYPAGKGNSNNVAEYLGLKLGLQKLIDLGMTDKEIVVNSDSDLVINQMLNRYAIRSGYYKEVALETRVLVKRFRNIKFKWISREDNWEADRLSRKYAE